MKIKEMNVMHGMQLKEFLCMIHSLCSDSFPIRHLGIIFWRSDSIKTYMMMPSWITVQSLLNFNATSLR